MTDSSKSEGNRRKPTPLTHMRLWFLLKSLSVEKQILQIHKTLFKPRILKSERRTF